MCWTVSNVLCSGIDPHLVHAPGRVAYEWAVAGGDSPPCVTRWFVRRYRIAVAPGVAHPCNISISIVSQHASSSEQPNHSRVLAHSNQRQCLRLRLRLRANRTTSRDTPKECIQEGIVKYAYATRKHRGERPTTPACCIRIPRVGPYTLATILKKK